MNGNSQAAPDPHQPPRPHRPGCALLAAAALLIAGVTILLMARLFESLREEARKPLPVRPPSLDFVSAPDLLRIPPATRFAFPLGSPRGALSYNAQPFLENNHLGDDWNGVGGQDTDLGDPVHAIADGMVTFAADVGGGWGGIVIVQHRLPDDRGGDDRLLQSFYAHLADIHVRPGDILRVGDPLGTVGNAGGRYWAHLHLEVREFQTRHIGAGYRRGKTDGWLDPTRLINSRLAPPCLLHPPSPRE